MESYTAGRPVTTAGRPAHTRAAQPSAATQAAMHVEILKHSKFQWRVVSVLFSNGIFNLKMVNFFWGGGAAPSPPWSAAPIPSRALPLDPTGGGGEWRFHHTRHEKPEPSIYLKLCLSLKAISCVGALRNRNIYPSTLRCNLWGQVCVHTFFAKVKYTSALTMRALFCNVHVRL